MNGHVEGYSLRGASVAVTVSDRRACRRTAIWTPFTGDSRQTFRATSARCAPAGMWMPGASVLVPERAARPLQAFDGARRVVLGVDGVLTMYRGDAVTHHVRRVASTPALKVAVSDERAVVLAEGSSWPDRPFRLEVYATATGRQLHDWPLVGRPTTLDVHSGIAVFTARNSGGVFALRLLDGKTTLLGPVQPGDTPQISRYGVVFQSNLYKRFNRQGRAFMKFVSTPVLHRSFQRTFDTLELRWPVKSFAMDGSRVAVTLDTPRGTCDPVRFWNIPWHSFTRINMERDITCTHRMSAGRLTIAGIGAAWVATKSGSATMMVSDGDACIEHVAGALRSAKTPLAGDGLLLAFAAPNQNQSRATGEEIVLVNWKTHEHISVRSPSSARTLSVDQDRVAVLRADGLTDLFAADGTWVATLQTAHPRAVALRGDELGVFTRAGTLEVWNVRTRARGHVWQLPHGTQPALDMHYGIAVFSAGRAVYALRLNTGRTVELARAPSEPQVQIEGSGVAYQYDAGVRSVIKFVRLAAVERALGLP